MTRIDQVYNLGKKMFGLIKTPIGLFATIVFATVFTHWAFVQLYVTFCAPWGIWGPFKLFITLGSPMCHFINTIQVELAKHYITIWLSAGASCIAWIASKVV